MLCTLFKGQALVQFDYHIGRRLNAVDSEVTNHELLEIVIRDLYLDYISRHIIRVQRYYMKRCLSLGPSITVQQFMERPNGLNGYFLCFPEEYPMQLNKGEITEILNQAKSPEWHEAMVSANIDLFAMDYEKIVVMNLKSILLFPQMFVELVVN